MENSNKNSRRAFIKKGAVAALGLGVFNSLKIEDLAAADKNLPREINPVHAAFELPNLGYDYGALEPYIDLITMTIHHSKHHQAYITKLNEAVAKTAELQHKSLMDLITNINGLPESARSVVRNHGGGHYNHSFFWKLMSPTAKDSKAGDALAAAINTKWGSFDNFKVEFAKSATGVFGSGWAWLVKDKENSLSIITTPNQDSPVMDIMPQRTKPILAIDVWEHAYYLKHQNKRVDYITDFWNVVDWNQVTKWYAEV